MGIEIWRSIIYCLFLLEADGLIGETIRSTNNLMSCGNNSEIKIKNDGIIYT